MERVAVGEACTHTCTQDGASTSCFGSGGGGDVERQCYSNDGGYCDAMGMCAALKVEGEACTSSTECVDTLRCDTDAGACAPRLPEGESCFGDECAEGLFCGGEPRACTALKAIDEACEFSDECASGACDGERCTDEGSFDDLARGLICGLFGG